MTVPLRWKLQLLAVLVPLLFGLAALGMVNDSVSRRARSDVGQQLHTAARVLEEVYASRGRALDMTAQVIARDPRFFSALGLPAHAGDPHFRATVRGVARDFQRLASTDLFEIYDRRGTPLASAGKTSSTRAGRGDLVRRALRGRAASGLVRGRSGSLQAAAMPVRVNGRVIGALLLGRRVGRELAMELRALTRSEVSFLSGGRLTTSTLPAREDRLALRTMLTPGAGAELRLPSGTYLTLVEPLPGSRSEDRQLYALQRSLDVELAFLRELQAGLVRIAFAALVAALLIALLLAREISQPIRRLVRGAEEMERGNYGYPLSAHGRDEIGYLTERFLLMRERERAYVESLEEVARLKSRFIQVASHELRTPVTILQSYGELLADGTLGPVTPEQRRALDEMHASLAQIVRISESATSMAQLESERPVLTLGVHEVGSMVEEAVSAALMDAPGRTVRVERHVEPGLGRARFDRPRLTQAVANLVRNAVRFTPDGGWARVSARREGSELVLEIQDRGVGIAAEDLQRLLGPAFLVRDPRHHHSSRTLEFNSAGMGLGLPVALGIVKAHGGTVAAESAPGAGTTIVLRLPTSFEPWLEPRQSPAPARAA